MGAPLSATLEDYIETVRVLSSADRGARVGDIAGRVNVHESTVAAALHSLGERGLVDHAPYKPVTLTQQSRRLGAETNRQPGGKRAGRGQQ